VRPMRVPRLKGGKGADFRQLSWLDKL